MKVMDSGFRVSPRPLVMFVTCLTVAASLSASAQQVAANTASQIKNDSTSFHRTWQIGAYGSGGFAPHYAVGNLLDFRYQKEQQFYTVTFEVGRLLTASHGPSILKGRAEAIVEVTPFWLTHSPPQVNTVHSFNGFIDGRTATFPGYYQHGASFTPLLFRWNFIKHDSSRHTPWLQGGAGVLWTNKRFPQGSGFPGGNTSVINFTPQFGLGENLFVRKNQSLNVGIRAIQYNNAGLGQINPGIFYTLNFSVGYSWWK